MKKILMALIYSGSLLYIPGAFSADKTVTGVAENSGASVKDSSGKASSSNKQGQVMSLLMGGMLAAQSASHFSTCAGCSGSHPCPWECVKGAIAAGMAAMSMMQAKEHGSVAGASGLTSGLTDGGTNPYDTGSYDPTTIDTKNPDIQAANDAFKKIQSTGAINTTTGKITTPDGKTYNVKDFASEKAMAAAGIPSGAIKGAMSNAAALEKKASEKAEKIVASANASSEDSFGGGGGGSTTIVGVDDEAGGMGAGRGKGLGLSKRDPAQLAGMQKNYNGEPIGVAADSIFLMMNRRYQVKQSQDSFFGDMDLRLQK